jgi:hypothetical protein
MRSHTEKELKVWLAWLDMQWDQPDRTDCYLMQVACEVRRVLARNPRAIHVKDFKLKFPRRSRTKVMSKEQAAAWSKARWFAAVGLDQPVSHPGA